MAEIRKIGFQTQAFLEFRKGRFHLTRFQLLDAMALSADQMVMVPGGPLVAFTAGPKIQFVRPSALDKKSDFAVKRHLIGPATYLAQPIGDALDAKRLSSLHQH
jgi:hypothetical protein